MPAAITSTQIQKYINDVKTGGVTAATQVYQQLLDKGYNYSGWAKGVAEGSTITGREALDFLTNSSLMGVGSDACFHFPAAHVEAASRPSMTVAMTGA